MTSIDGNRCGGGIVLLNDCVPFKQTIYTLCRWLCGTTNTMVLLQWYYYKGMILVQEGNVHSAMNWNGIYTIIQTLRTDNVYGRK